MSLRGFCQILYLSKSPKFITKYFKASDLKYFEEGSLRFGNISEYRRAEATGALTARGDMREGISLLVDGDPRQKFYSGQSSKNFPQSMRFLRFIDDVDRYYQGLPPGLSMGMNVRESKINAWVFCASIGHYRKCHHEKMLYGDTASGYAGNPELTNYCVFELSNLMIAISTALRKHERYSRRSKFSRSLYWSEVSYDWVEEGADSAVAFLKPPRPMRDEEVVKQLSTKRKVYTVEEEFRLIARIDERTSIDDDDPELIVQSPEIRSSILDFGPT